MEIKIIQGVKREVLEDVFVTALEGGSNYWYYLPEESIKAIRKAVPKSEDPYLSTAILKAILDHDVKVPINDAENEDEDDNGEMRYTYKIQEEFDAIYDEVFQYLQSNQIK